AVGDRTSCHFDGTRWRAVGIAMPSGIDRLFAVSARAANDVWAVGEREIDTATGAVLYPLVEHWTGSAWTAMTAVPGAALYGVDGLAANEVYAVGMDRTFSPYVMHWDGASWSVVPSPHHGNYSALRAVEALSRSDVWAAGLYHV